MSERTLRFLLYSALTAAVAAGPLRPPLRGAGGDAPAAAQGADPDAGNSTSSVHSPQPPKPTPAAPRKADGKAQSVSPVIADALATEVAEFGTQSPGPEDNLDAAKPSSGDKAADEIRSLPIRQMPKYSVLGSRVFVFRERDLYTKAGMVELSFERHPGLFIGNPFNLNANKAYEIFLDDDWRQTKGDYWEMAHAMELGGDYAESQMILKAIKDEDLRMRGEDNDEARTPSSDPFAAGRLEGDPRLLEMPEHPIDISFVRLNW